MFCFWFSTGIYPVEKKWMKNEQKEEDTNKVIIIWPSLDPGTLHFLTKDPTDCIEIEGYEITTIPHTIEGFMGFILALPESHTKSTV